MSPEQAAGWLDDLGPQSDVYGLGATLYCLLTGKSPIEGAGLDLDRILDRVHAASFPRPRRRSWCAARPGSDLPQGDGPACRGSLCLATCAG